MLHFFSKRKLTQFNQAITSGHEEHLVRLLKALPPETLNQPLINNLLPTEIAIQAEQAKSLTLLLNSGALSNPTLGTGTSLVHLALKQSNSLALITPLLEQGAEVRGYSGELINMCFSHVAPSQWMLHLNRFSQYGLDINQPDQAGNTALDHALRHQDKELLSFLINSGVNTPEEWPDSLSEELKAYLTRSVADLQIRQMFLGA